MMYKVKILWDQDAAVWIATSDDVPGLVLESGSFDALVERIKLAIPELVTLNGNAVKNYKVQYTTERIDMVPAYG